MIQQITKGIKISVNTNFEGRHFHQSQLFYFFSYCITIENQSNDTVQLTSRHWNIYDSLNDVEVIEGEGVIGKKPILKPKETHTYTSNCLLRSPAGSMNGFYNMTNFSNSKKFMVQIPTFQLIVPATFN